MYPTGMGVVGLSLIRDAAEGIVSVPEADVVIVGGQRLKVLGWSPDPLGLLVKAEVDEQQERIDVDKAPDADEKTTAVEVPTPTPAEPKRDPDPAEEAEKRAEKPPPESVEDQAAREEQKRAAAEARADATDAKLERRLKPAAHDEVQTDDAAHDEEHRNLSGPIAVADANLDQHLRQRHGVKSPSPWDRDEARAIHKQQPHHENAVAAR